MPHSNQHNNDYGNIAHLQHNQSWYDSDSTSLAIPILYIPQALYLLKTSQ